MLYRKFLSFFLFILSFVIISIGGYQCATQVSHDPRESIPIVPAPISTPGSSLEKGQNSRGGTSFVNNQLPDEPDDGCARGQIRDLEERYGAIGNLKLDVSGLDDYRFGEVSNFPVNCARMYLNMSEIKSESVFKGRLTISYQEGGKIKVQKFLSGYSANENKYNKWTWGRWTANSRDKVDKKFYAIFEDAHSAIILTLEDVRVDNSQGDGNQSHIGAGYIYYKMFRIWDGDRNDVCYSKGTYVSRASNKPPKRSRCWLLGTGPYSCRPNGVLSPGQRLTDIDLTGDLDCYSVLGRFYSLNIEDAFNVDSVSDL